MILTDARIVIDELEISSDANSVTCGGGREAKDDGRFGKHTRCYESGVLTWQFEAMGKIRAGLDESLDVKYENFDEALISVFRVGAVIGDPGYAMTGAHAEYTPFNGARWGEPLAFMLRAVSRGRRVRSKLLATGAKAATFTGTGVQIAGGVPSGKKLYAGLHVTAVSGVAPTLDVVLQSDDNAGFLSPTTRITFPTKSAVGAQFATPITGPITDDRFRMVGTLGGTTPNFTVLGWFAVA